MRYVLAAVGCALLCALSLGANAQGESTQAFVGAQIIPISGPPIQNGVLVVSRGKIVAVGARSTTNVPTGAQVIDVSGKVIMPGLVDTHSHVGGGSGADGSGPIQPETRILDSINARDNSLIRARAGGITTVNVMPGSGHLSSGQTLYLKLRNGKVIDDLLIKDAKGNIAGGLKMANGTNSLRPGTTGPFPGTRAKSVSLVREQFVKAQEYRQKIERAKGDVSKLPARDLALEILIEAMEGKRVVHFHTHRHDDILTALRLSKEFGFRIVLQHVSEGWKVTNEIAAAKAPASIIVIDSPGGKLETVDVSYQTGAMMERAGILVGFHTDDYITDSRLFLRSAGLAVRAGMSRDKALYAMTMAGARMLDLQNRVGSLEAGKDADFLILSGDPLSAYTKVLETYIEGVRVFDRNNPADRLYAVGGYGAGRDQLLDFDCFDHGVEKEK
ncbi:MAG TPA: amidohydrolase family protein [Pyrinomonadaceae bacterium]|nr:amidohydrolase family protein [Pyrinomonadaceae bacterium]